MAITTTAYKIQGQTNAAAPIATIDVTLGGDGALRFTSAAGVKVVLQGPELNRMLKEIFNLSEVFGS